MPIKKENRLRYPADWAQIRKRILVREGYRCRRCKAPDRERIARGAGKDAGTYQTSDAEVYDAETGECLGTVRMTDFELDHMVTVVLTIAHLDQVPEHNDESNLAALCQRCHLQHDREPSKAKGFLTRHLGRGVQDMFGFEGDQQ